MGVRRKRPEAALQKAVAQYLNAALDPSLTMWRGIENQPRSAIAGANQKARGIQAGTPDILIWWRGREDRLGCLAIELKSPEGGQSKPQKAFQDSFRHIIGAGYSICRSCEDVERAIFAWGIPIRYRRAA